MILAKSNLKIKDIEITAAEGPKGNNNASQG